MRAESSLKNFSQILQKSRAVSESPAVHSGCYIVSLIFNIQNIAGCNGLQKQETNELLKGLLKCFVKDLAVISRILIFNMKPNILQLTSMLYVRNEHCICRGKFGNGNLNKLLMLLIRFCCFCVFI